MNRSHRALFAVILLAFSVSLAANLPNEWRSWRYSRVLSGFAIEMDHTPVSIGALPWEVLAHSKPAASDFRIVDDLGRETPYFLATPSSESKTEMRLSHILERSFVVGQFTQIVVRVTDWPALNESHAVTPKQLDAEPWFNTYQIVTSATDFMYWVETAVSDDAHQWRIIDARSPISRFRKRGLNGNQTIHFDGYSNQRFLRIRILDPEAQFLVDSVDVFSRSTSEPPRSPIPALFSLEQSSEKTESRWRVDLHSSSIPVNELLFSTDQVEFYRAVRLSSSADDKEWDFVAGGEIYRYRQAGKSRQSLRIDFPETFARFWRIDVINADDPPLSNAAPQLRGANRRLTFRAERSRSYRLLYGNDRAFAPHYDFARVFDPAERNVLPAAQLGPEELTLNYADPRPFTERHPSLLWIVVGIAVALLAGAAVRSLRSSKSLSEG